MAWVEVLVLPTPHRGPEPRVLAPDCLVEVPRPLDRLDVPLEPCPTLETILSREHELDIGERHRIGRTLRRAGNVRTYAADGVGIAGAELAQQLLGLFAKLLEGRTSRQGRLGSGHTISFHERPRPPDGLKGNRALST